MENHIFKYNKSFTFESGESIEQVVISYSTSGKLNEDKSNVIWVCHALTANSEAESWWHGLVGENYFFNPSKYFIICANIISSCYGSSGPAEINPSTKRPYYLNFPKTSIRDMVAVHDLLREELGINKIHTLIGGSLGGQQALEWAICKPDVVSHLVLLATNAFHSPWGIAFNESQRMAIKADPTWNEESLEAGHKGLSAARAIALLSYRNYNTYNSTQLEEDVNRTESFKAVSYQNYQGEKLVKRFNCHSYLYLSWAMDTHNVGRRRGTVQKALSMVKAKTMVIGIKSDILFPVSEQIFLAANIQGAEYQEIDSLYGHDGFLIETEKIAKALTAFYDTKMLKASMKV